VITSVVSIFRFTTGDLPGHKVRFESNDLKADLCAATISISFDRFSGARQQLCPFGYWWWSSNQFSLSNPSG
jgi:hypothetical protein